MGMMASGSACDTVSLLSCTTSASTSITNAGEDQSAMCGAVDTYVTCVTSACAGCGAAVQETYQTTLEQWKTTYCGEAATTNCDSSEFCTAILECAADTEPSFSESLSPSVVVLSSMLLPFIGQRR